MKTSKLKAPHVLLLISFASASYADEYYAQFKFTCDFNRGHNYIIRSFKKEGKSYTTDFEFAKNYGKIEFFNLDATNYTASAIKNGKLISEVGYMIDNRRLDAVAVSFIGMNEDANFSTTVITVDRKSKENKYLATNTAYSPDKAGKPTPVFNAGFCEIEYN